MRSFMSFHAGLLAASLLSSTTLSGWAAQAEEKPADRIESIAIYTDLIGFPEYIPFFKSCGYNTYQCWDMGWSKPIDTHDQFYAEMAEGIRRVQEAGFRVYVLLSTNLSQRRSADQKDYEMQFDPNDEALMTERLGYIEKAVRKLKGADGFTIAPGDPGGHEKAAPAQFVEMARKMLDIVRKEAPGAELTVNLWAIFYWDHFPSPFKVESWDRDIEMTRDFIAIEDIIGPQVNVEFPMHNYYRSLALKLYADAGREPGPVPTAEDVRRLKDRGVKRIWGWPYFLTDECDDGYKGTTSGLTQSETRYIKQIVDISRRVGLNGLVANAFASNIFAETLNLYAFAQFCQNPQLTPDAVIRDFAGLVSEPGTADDLVQVIRFIENHSTWQSGLPEKYRLPNFDTGTIATAANARERLAGVQVRSAWTRPFPKTPRAYADKLDERLRILVEEENEAGK